MQVFKQQASLFKSSFFAGGINVNEHLCNGEEGCKSIHNLVSDYALMQLGHKKAARNTGRL
jgi:hypothetical protein